MLFITISLAISSTFAGYHGGNGGHESTLQCSSGNYVESFAIRSGSRLDAFAIKCTNEERWSEWKGGRGGIFHWVHSSGSGFCGLGGRSENVIHKLCLGAVDGEVRCFGSTSSSGNEFIDRLCRDSPGNSRARLTGLTVRAGALIDGLMPHWDVHIDCPYYLQIANSGASFIDGYYSFDGFYNGHHKYKHNDNGACVYYANRAWRIHENCNTDSWNIKIEASSKYNICPSGLSGQNGWYRQGKGNIYPTLQIEGYSSLPLAPLEWGNAVGYWAWITSGSGSSGGSTQTWTTSLTDTSSTSRTFSATEEESFSKTWSHTGTTGIEIGVEKQGIFGFGTLSASAKWSASYSLSHSTTETTRTATTNALENAWQKSNTASRSCHSIAPVFGDRWGVDDKPWVLYAWEVYRASNVENVGATQMTCAFQYQTGPCVVVPPNCPLGMCVDKHCIQCVAGVEPLRSLSEIQDEYPGCLDSLNINPELRCALDKSDWECCSAASPCGLHQGDCDFDWECAGELVCSHNSFCRDNPDICPHESFDVCVSPDRRELSQGDEDDDPHYDDLVDEVAENQASRQKSRLLQDEKLADLKPKDLDEPLEESLNADDLLSEDEWVAEHQTVSGCIQFDDEGHCTAGPLYKYCRWEANECVNKENIKDEDVPEGDFSYVYGSPEPFFMHE